MRVSTHGPCASCSLATTHQMPTWSAVLMQRPNCSAKADRVGVGGLPRGPRNNRWWTVFKLKQFPQWIVGPPRDPVDPGTRRGLLLTAVLASAGLGANGLSSACY